MTSTRGWSSDVCSSDLNNKTAQQNGQTLYTDFYMFMLGAKQIGRASCRERKYTSRLDSGGIQQIRTLILNTFVFGLMNLFSTIYKRLFISQLAAKLRNR